MLIMKPRLGVSSVVCPSCFYAVFRICRTNIFQLLESSTFFNSNISESPVAESVRCCDGHRKLTSKIQNLADWLYSMLKEKLPLQWAYCRLGKKILRQGPNLTLLSYKRIPLRYTRSISFISYTRVYFQRVQFRTCRMFLLSLTRIMNRSVNCGGIICLSFLYWGHFQ